MLTTNQVKVVTASVLKPEEHLKGDFFVDKTVLALVSNGQLYQEGDNFAAFIDVIKVCHPKNVVFLNTAYLQRYNKRIFDKEYNMATSEEARLKIQEQLDQQALKEEELWDIEKKPYLEQVSNRSETLHWTQYVIQKQKQFEVYRKEVEIWRKSDDKIQADFEETANNYLNPHKAKLLDYSKSEKRYVDICVQYLEEEVTVLYLMVAKEGWQFLFYPRSITQALYDGYCRFVLGKKQLQEKKKEFHVEAAVKKAGANYCMVWKSIKLEEKNFQPLDPRSLNLNFYQGFSYYVQKFADEFKIKVEEDAKIEKQRMAPESKDAKPVSSSSSFSSSSHPSFFSSTAISTKVSASSSTLPFEMASTILPSVNTARTELFSCPSDPIKELESVHSPGVDFSKVQKAVSIAALKLVELQSCLLNYVADPHQRPCLNQEVVNDLYKHLLITCELIDKILKQQSIDVNILRPLSPPI